MSQHQTCKHCGRVQRFEFAVTDDLWMRTTGDYPFALCIECWLAMADEAGSSICGSDIIYLGISGAKVSTILLDRVPA